MTEGGRQGIDEDGVCRQSKALVLMRAFFICAYKANLTVKITIFNPKVYYIFKNLHKKSSANR